MEMSTPRGKDVQSLWAHEITSLTTWIGRIRSEARAYANMAESCKEYAPDLVQEYLDWARWANQRALAAVGRRQKIRDYLAGKIGPWW